LGNTIIPLGNTINALGNIINALDKIIIIVRGLLPLRSAAREWTPAARE
jgi:hypothetical protein